MKLVTMMYAGAIPDAVLAFSHDGLAEFDVVSVNATGPRTSAIVMRTPTEFTHEDWQRDLPGYRKRMRDAARRWRRGEPETLVLNG